MPVRNICNCDNPPGGVQVCDPHQIAVCGTIDGVVYRDCITPNRGMMVGFKRSIKYRPHLSRQGSKNLRQTRLGVTSRHSLVSPKTYSAAVVLVDWAFKAVTSQKMGGRVNVLQDADLDFLLAGEYQRAGTSIRFKLPESVNYAVRVLKLARSKSPLVEEATSVSGLRLRKRKNTQA